jgi:hypothetical protein
MSLRHRVRRLERTIEELDAKIEALIERLKTERPNDWASIVTEIIAEAQEESGKGDCP